MSRRGRSQPKISESVIRCVRPRTNPSRSDASSNTGALPVVGGRALPGCPVHISPELLQPRALPRHDEYALAPLQEALMYSAKGLSRPPNRSSWRKTAAEDRCWFCILVELPSWLVPSSSAPRSCKSSWSSDQVTYGSGKSGGSVPSSMPICGALGPAPRSLRSCFPRATRRRSGSMHPAAR